MSSCPSERPIEIKTLVTDTIIEESVSETIVLTAGQIDQTALTTFVSARGTLIVRVSVSGSGYSAGIFTLVRNDSADGIVHDITTKDGDLGERVGLVWDGAAGPSLLHKVIRSSGDLTEEITYRLTLDTAA